MRRLPTSADDKVIHKKVIVMNSGDDTQKTVPSNFFQWFCNSSPWSVMRAGLNFGFFLFWVLVGYILAFLIPALIILVVGYMMYTPE